MAVSDQNLELLPDYQQRVSVLQDLQFIDDTSTVLLKGRVACEVGATQRARFEVERTPLTGISFTDTDQLCERAGAYGADSGECAGSVRA